MQNNNLPRNISQLTFLSIKNIYYEKSNFFEKMECSVVRLSAFGLHGSNLCPGYRPSIFRIQVYGQPIHFCGGFCLEYRFCFLFFLFELREHLPVKTGRCFFYEGCGAEVKPRAEQACCSVASYFSPLKFSAIAHIFVLLPVFAERIQVWRAGEDAWSLRLRGLQEEGLLRPVAVIRKAGAAGMDGKGSK